MEPQPQHLQSPHSRAHPSRRSRPHPFVVPAKAATHVTRTSPSRHSRPHPFVLPAKAGTHVTRTSPSVRPERMNPHTPATLSPSVRPERREQVVHPAVKLDAQPAPEVEGHPPHPSHETTNPNLTSYPNAATKTTQTRPNTPPSYNPRRGPAPQITQNHPQNTHSQLRHKTNKTKLISYDHAAIETTSRYEKPISSYGTGRTLADNPPKTPPTQIGDKTMTSKLNSYNHAATPIIPDPPSVIPDPPSVIPDPPSVIPTPLSVIPTEGRNPNTPLTPPTPSVRPERRQSVVHPACQGQTYNRLPESKDPAPNDPQWAEMSGNDADSPISTLTFRQQAALPAVAMAPTLSQAARDSGVGLSTLRRWLQEPEFRQQLANFRQESADLARQQAQAILPRCLSVFAEVMECPDPSLRLRAARYAMAFALQITEAHDLKSRLEQLEQSIIPSTDA